MKAKTPHSHSLHGPAKNLENGDHSPSVTNKIEWENLSKRVKSVSPDSSNLLQWIWLSATEGDYPSELPTGRRKGRR